MCRRLLVAVVGISLAAPVAADYLTVSRAAPVRRAADSSSDRVAEVEDGTFLTILDNGDQTDGYYHVKAGNKAGFIYRTFVRRHPGNPPITMPPAARGAGGAVVAAAG